MCYCIRLVGDSQKESACKWHRTARCTPHALHAVGGPVRSAGGRGSRAHRAIDPFLNQLYACDSRVSPLLISTFSAESRFLLEIGSLIGTSRRANQLISNSIKNGGKSNF